LPQLLEAGAMVALADDPLLAAARRQYATMRAAHELTDGQAG
jgi:hypothetical protein